VHNGEPSWLVHDLNLKVKGLDQGDLRLFTKQRFLFRTMEIET